MSPDHRTRKPFHEELDTLQATLLEMAGLVEHLVADAVGAVFRKDPDAAAGIERRDSDIDDLEMEIDERVTELLALQQPMATDLRLIVSTLKASNDLERVGDHAVNMAKAARRLTRTHPVPEIREIEEMAGIAREMLSDALAAFVSRNAGTARMVCITDDKVDNLRRSMFRILVTHMLEDPKRIGGALELLLVSQNLERIADLSTNIAEDVVFLVEGRSMKHQVQERSVAPADRDAEPPGES